MIEARIKLEGEDEKVISISGHGVLRLNAQQFSSISYLLPDISTV